MTIWLLAVVLLAALAALGLRQGAIRVLLSFFGIVLGGVLAAPLGHLLKPALSAAGIKHPVWLEFLPPCIAFLIVLTIFKIIGAILNKKVEEHFKNKASELQAAMWERLNHRLGMCLGFFNGAAYFVLISVAVYLLSYWTYQMATPDSDPKGVRVLNRMGADLQRTGMNRVAGAVNRMPPSYFEAADIVGVMYHNPLLQARLSRYPGILGLAEQPEFQDLGNDQAFNQLVMSQPPILKLIDYPKVQAIIKNPDTMKKITAALVPNLTDLQNYLTTGKSDVFTNPILGRWDFDVIETMALIRAARPNLTAAESKKYREALNATFTKTTLVMAPGNVAVLKDYPHVTPATPPAAPTIQLQTYNGKWDGDNGTYTISLPIEGKDQQLTGKISGDRLAVKNAEVNMGFVRED